MTRAPGTLEPEQSAATADDAAEASEIEIDVGAARLCVQVQRACEGSDLPTDAEIARWAGAALSQGAADLGEPAMASLSVRLVDEAEGAELNRYYRGRDGATNVLSFPFEQPDGLPPEALTALGPELTGQLGDLVLCVPVLRREAAAQGKRIAAHTAHLIVHGTLHLLGHDHIDPTEATAMETLETAILAGLGFASPYAVDDDQETGFT